MRAEWGIRSLVAAAIVVCGFAFTPLVSGLDWLVRPTLLVLLASLGMAITATVARRRGWPLLVGAGVSLLALTGMFAPGSGLLFVIPGFGTASAFRRLAVDGGQSIASQSIPAQPDEGIVFLLAVGMTGLVLAGELIVFVARIPALIGVPLLAVSVIPNLIDPSTVQLVLFLVLAALYVAILLVRRVGTRPTVVIAGAVAVLGALGVVALLPPVTPNENPPSQFGGVSIAANPIVNLGDDLRRPDPVVAYTYQSSLSSSSYFTLSVLDDFSGLQWRPDDFAAAGDVSAIGPDPDRPKDAATTEVLANVTVGDISGRLLPVPWAPETVSGLDGGWAWDGDSLSVRSDSASIQHQSYSVRSAIATPSVEQLEAAGTQVPDAVSRFLAVPDGMPGVIGQTARDVTANATTSYDKAVALQSFFHGSDFHYSTSAPVEQGYDGSGANVVAEFLAKKYGYCVHFSSAMALMARSLGIPARLGVGFTGGTAQVDASGVTTYTVTTDDLHSWPELYFAGVGWVRFEPTPGIGSVPVFSTSRATDAPPTSSAPSSPPDSSSPSSSSTASAPTLPPEQQQPTGSGVSTQSLRGVLWPVLIVLIVLLFVFAPLVTRALRRRWRYRALAGGDALAAWNEVRDTAIDVGLPVLATRSARELAADLAEGLGPDSSPALGRVLAAVERAAYARDTGDDLAVADVAEVRRAILRSAAVGDRVRALLLPRSLLRR